MSSWAEFSAEVPEFARRVQERFDAGTHKTIATLRSDGSPRISGTELSFVDGQVRLGMMPGSRKGDDVRADPRVAIHSPTADPPTDPAKWAGEAKLSGRLLEVMPPPDSPVEDGSFFTLDIAEAVLTHLDETASLLVVESWHPVRGHELRSRR